MVIAGKQSQVCVDSAPTCFATFCAKAEPVWQLWAVSASFLLLAERTKNPSSGFGQNIVSCCPCKFTHCSLLSPSGGERSGPEVAEVAAAGGHVSEYPGTPRWAAPTTGVDEGGGGGLEGSAGSEGGSPSPCRLSRRQGSANQPKGTAPCPGTPLLRGKEAH